MGTEKINIGEAELEIMKVLWKESDPISTQQICAAVEERGWKRTTISTFLARLVQKGALSTEKRGKLYFYTPLISRKEYRKNQTKNLIKSLYDGSVHEFAVSFLKDGSLTEKDIIELRAVLNETEG